MTCYFSKLWLLFSLCQVAILEQICTALITWWMCVLTDYTYVSSAQGFRGKYLVVTAASVSCSIAIFCYYFFISTSLIHLSLILSFRSI